MGCDHDDGIVTGAEDRQLLYTMLTGGRVENHAHIVLTADDTHTLPSPTDDRVVTATEVLDRILVRDGRRVRHDDARQGKLPGKLSATIRAGVHTCPHAHAESAHSRAKSREAPACRAGQRGTPTSSRPTCGENSRSAGCHGRTRRRADPPGPPPHDDSEAAYHRNLTNRINARY